MWRVSVSSSPSFKLASTYHHRDSGAVIGAVSNDKFNDKTAYILIRSSSFSLNLYTHVHPRSSGNGFVRLPNLGQGIFDTGDRADSSCSMKSVNRSHTWQWRIPPGRVGSRIHCVPISLLIKSGALAIPEFVKFIGVMVLCSTPGFN